MVRMYKQFAEKLLMLMLYHNDAQRSWRDVRRYVGDDIQWNTLPKPVNQTVTNAFGNMNPDEFDTEVMDDIIHLSEQIEHEGKNNDKDLIDTIVRVLQLPNNGNRLNGKMIQALQKAILVPEEIAGLNHVLQQEFRCGGCQHKFVDGESVTFRSGPETGIVRMFCSNCAPPMRFQCVGCGQSSQLKQVSTVFKKQRTCPTCLEKMKQGGVPERTDQQEEVMQPEIRGGRVFLGADTVAPPPPPPTQPRTAEPARQAARNDLNQIYRGLTRTAGRAVARNPFANQVVQEAQPAQANQGVQAVHDGVLVNNNPWQLVVNDEGIEVNVALRAANEWAARENPFTDDPPRGRQE